MHPVLFGFFGAYPAFFVLGDLLGIAFALQCATRSQVPVRRFAAVLLVATVGALLGAKLYGLIERGWTVGLVSYEFFSGYRYPGGLIGCTIGIWLAGRRFLPNLSPGLLADIVAPSFGFALAVVRIGCFLAGCCSGSICNLPWAIRFPRGSQPWHLEVGSGALNLNAPLGLPVHPLQLYFAIVGLVLGILAMHLQAHKSYDGQVFLVFVALYGGAQFLLEFLRFGPLPHVQYMALASCIIASVALAAKALRRKEQYEPA